MFGRGSVSSALSVKSFPALEKACAKKEATKLAIEKAKHSNKTYAVEEEELKKLEKEITTLQENTGTYIQCAARITRHRAISLSPRGRPARRFDPQMGSDFESLGINFEARAVILGSWTLIFRISEMDVCFYRKSAFADPPPRHTVTRILQSYGLTVF